MRVNLTIECAGTAIFNDVITNIIFLLLSMWVWTVLSVFVYRNKWKYMGIYENIWEYIKLINRCLLNLRVILLFFVMLKMRKLSCFMLKLQAGTKNVLKLILGSKNHSILHAVVYFYIFRRLIATSSSMLRLVAFELHLALITFNCLIARQEK